MFLRGHGGLRDGIQRRQLSGAWDIFSGVWFSCSCQPRVPPSFSLSHEEIFLMKKYVCHRFSITSSRSTGFGDKVAELSNFSTSAVYLWSTEWLEELRQFDFLQGIGHVDIHFGIPTWRSEGNFEQFLKSLICPQGIV